MDIIDRITSELGDDRGAQKKFADATGILSSNITNWKKDKSENKSVALINYANKLVNIANYFGWSVNYLVTGEESQSVLSDDEQQLLDLYKKLSKEDQIRVMERIQTLYDLENEDKSEDSITITLSKEQQWVQNYAEMLQEYIEEGKPPITFSIDNNTSPIRRYEYSAGAGFNTPAPQPDDYTIINLPQSCIPYRANSIIHISGDSMEPDYPNDCWVWVNTNVYGNIQEFCNKEVIAINEGEALFKVCEPKGLRSINPKYHNIYGGEDCRVIGEVLGIVDLNEMLKGL